MLVDVSANNRNSSAVNEEKKKRWRKKTHNVKIQMIYFVAYKMCLLDEIQILMMWKLSKRAQPFKPEWDREKKMAQKSKNRKELTKNT